MGDRRIKNYHLRYVRSYLSILLSAAILVFICVYAVILFVPQTPSNEVRQTPVPTDTPVEVTNRVKIQLAGDIVLNNTLLSSSHDAYGAYDFKDYFSNIKDFIDGDLTVFNLEGNINAYGDGSNFAGAPAFNYPQEIAAAASDAGFNTVITANDQAANFSYAGMKNTLENLTAVGLVPVGTRQEEGTGYLKNYNGIQIGILAYTEGLAQLNSDIPEYAVTRIDTDDVETSAERIRKDIADMKQAGAEIVVLSMHWGKEMVAEPSQNQRRLADELIYSGADIIMGTLSHTLQPITYKSIVTDTGEEKNVIVAYSLGNFLSHPTVTSGQTSQESVILNIYIERDAAGTAYISSAECVPIYIYAKALSSGGTTYSYSVLPAAAYISAESKPEIFASDEDWENCKKAYDNIKKIIDKSAENGMALGIS